MPFWHDKVFLNWWLFVLELWSGQPGQFLSVQGTNPTIKNTALLKNRFTFICAGASGICQMVELGLIWGGLQ